MCVTLAWPCSRCGVKGTDLSQWLVMGKRTLLMWQLQLVSNTAMRKHPKLIVSQSGHLREGSVRDKVGMTADSHVTDVSC